MHFSRTLSITKQTKTPQPGGSWLRGEYRSWLLAETQPEPRQGQEAAPALPASNHGAGEETQPA